MFNSTNIYRRPLLNRFSLHLPLKNAHLLGFDKLNQLTLPQTDLEPFDVKEELMSFWPSVMCHIPFWLVLSSHLHPLTPISIFQSEPPAQPKTIAHHLSLLASISLHPSHFLFKPSHTFCLHAPCLNFHHLMLTPSLSHSLYSASFLCRSPLPSPDCFPKGVALKLRENIQAWNSPERVVNTHLLFHFQDETRALILKNPVCPGSLVKQLDFHLFLAVSCLPCIHLLALFRTNSLYLMTLSKLLLFHLGSSVSDKFLSLFWVHFLSWLTHHLSVLAQGHVSSAGFFFWGYWCRKWPQSSKFSEILL